MHQDCERIMLTEQQISKRVTEIAAQISTDYAGTRPLMISILKGSIVFYTDLLRALDIPVELDFMAVSSYGSGTTSSGQLKIKKDLEVSVVGKDVINIKDIIDSGITLSKLKKLLIDRGAATVKVVTLLDKFARRTVAIESDYNGFQIEDEFVIGYGLDYNEHYRTLPYIGILKRSVYEK
ncbi:MAG: hypoxanthine phosphoribosyltransferase [Clostridia bacterium]|nr:hypoxanthine phosphoribosyltransferase [Clostridia bacterium]